MKKNIFILLYFIFFTVSALATQLISQEKLLRDSIFKTYQSQSDVDEKLTYIRTVFYNNIDKKWATELLDSALTLSIASNNNVLELNIRRDYYMHYKYASDLPKMEYYFGELKAACLKYKFYILYFVTWNDMLQFYNVRGDTEYTRMQSLKMLNEAKKVECEEGIMYAQMSMAGSLAASKKEEEAIKIFRKALKSNVIKPMTKVLIHAEIATAYQQIGKNEEAIKELHLQKKVLKQYIDKNPTLGPKLKENLMELELSYCTAYESLDDADNLLEHLKEAKKYYTPDCFFSNYIGYHAYWGAYYRLTHQWKACFHEFDMASAHFDNTKPLYEMMIWRMKGKALIEAEQYKEAAHLYKSLSMMGDSLNNEVLQFHEVALEANYNIRKALLDKENLEKQYYMIAVTLLTLSMVAVLLMVLRTRKVHKTLYLSELETRKALETVDAANKMKEVFLRNITHQIREPLNVVVGFSEILAAESDLTPEQIQEYSASVKKNADLLFQLIIDVLDLSRLESGMMKFNVSEHDAIQLCKDAKMAVEMQESNKAQLVFESNAEKLTIHTDHARFLKMLLSILSTPSDLKETTEVNFLIFCEHNLLKIRVENSPLLKQPDNIQQIKHDINRLFLEIFKGTYQLSLDKSSIIITYPLGENPNKSHLKVK